jgi:phage terminase small subunit
MPRVRSDPATGLNPMQRRFCNEYLLDFDAGAAYLRAGYKAGSRKLAQDAASRLLANPAVTTFLASRQSALQAMADVDQAAIMRQLSWMGMGDVRGLFNANGSVKDITELSTPQAALIQAIEVQEIEGVVNGERQVVGHTKRFRLVDRIKPLHLLGLQIGMFAQQHKHTGAVGVFDATQALSDEQLQRVAQAVLDGLAGDGSA